MKNGDLTAYPVPAEVYAEWIDSTDTRKGTIECMGLTKRETFAMAAMEGFCGNSSATEALLDESGIPSDKLAKMAVVTADALLKALEE